MFVGLVSYRDNDGKVHDLDVQEREPTGVCKGRLGSVTTGGACSMFRSCDKSG